MKKLVLPRSGQVVSSGDTIAVEYSEPGMVEDQIFWGRYMEIQEVEDDRVIVNFEDVHDHPYPIPVPILDELFVRESVAKQGV